MFSIRLLPLPEGGTRRHRLGEIVIGEHTESFDCYPAAGVPLGRLERCWRDQLRLLLAGAPVVALFHDPRGAWIIYRGDPLCYVQQHVTATGEFPDLLPHRTESEAGGHVSQWETTLPAIARFAAALTRRSACFR